jgi:hypothetical protein
MSERKYARLDSPEAQQNIAEQAAEADDVELDLTISKFEAERNKRQAAKQPQKLTAREIMEKYKFDPGWRD